MSTDSQRPKGRDGALSMLIAAIEALNLAKEISSVTPAKAVFGSVSVPLATIRASLFLFRDDELTIHADPGPYIESWINVDNNPGQRNPDRCPYNDPDYADLGCLAQTYTERSVGGWMGRNQMTSISPCVRR